MSINNNSTSTVKFPKRKNARASRKKEDENKSALDSLSVLSQDLISIFTNRLYCDVHLELRPSGKITPCHRAMLASRSSYFEKIFSAPPCSADSRILKVEIEEQDEASFERVLRFLYSGRLELASMEDAINLLKMNSAKYLVHNLTKVCRDYITEVRINGKKKKSQKSSFSALPPSILYSQEFKHGKCSQAISRFQGDRVHRDNLHMLGIYQKEFPRIPSAFEQQQAHSGPGQLCLKRGERR